MNRRAAFCLLLTFGFLCDLMHGCCSSAHAASVRTQNFVITAPSSELANKVAQKAEQCRRSESLEWFGREFPNWSQPCAVDVELQGSNSSGGGATSFVVLGGLAQQFTGHWVGPEDKLLADVVPHEVCHTILATGVGGYIPRWADEGSAMYQESPATRLMYANKAIESLRTHHTFPTDELHSFKKYPSDVSAFYWQSGSQAAFLIEANGKPAFITAIAEGVRSGWPASLKQAYGYTLKSFQDTWLDWVKHGSPPAPHTAAKFEWANGSWQGDQPEQSQESPPTVLAFHAVWCGPCREMDPVVASLKSEGYDIRPIDIDQSPTEASRYGVTAVPCFVAVQNGVVVGKLSGVVGRGELAKLCCTPRILRPRSAISKPALATAQPPSLPQPQNPQVMQPLQSGARDDQQDQHIEYIENWISIVKRTADDKAPLIGKNIPPFNPATRTPIGSDATLPAPVQLPNPPAAPGPSIDPTAIGEVVRSEVSPMFERLKGQIESRINSATEQLPGAASLKTALNGQAKQIVDDLAPTFKDAVATLPAVAAPFFEKAIPGLATTIGGPVAGGVATILISMLGGWLFKKKPPLPQIIGIATDTLKQAAPNVLHGGFDLSAAFKGIAASVAGSSPPAAQPTATSVPTAPATFVEQYFLNPAAADELAAKREVTQGMTKGQQGLLAQLHQEAMLHLGQGGFAGKVGKDLADAIELWVMQRFLTKHGVRTTLNPDATLSGQATI